MSRAILVALVALAIVADFVASDRPIVLHHDGTHFFENLGDGEPRGDRLRDTLGPDDWAVWAPIAQDPVEVRTDGALAILEPPSDKHWLGTDDRGRDVAARLVHGTRTTAEIAALAAALALALAVTLALLAMVPGGRAILVACDAIAAAPPILTVIAAQGLIAARGLLPLAVLIAIPCAADTARLCAAGLRAALVEPFVEAARAAGASHLRVLVRHALPQTAPVLAAATALTAATAVLSEAGLSFLGAGMPAPTPSWGELLAQADAHGYRWWLAWPAGVLITLATWALLHVRYAHARPRPARARRVR
jgi:peptide/nickel transport system permease protein